MTNYTMSNGHDAIVEALTYIPAEDRELWVKIAMAIKSELGEDGYYIWNEWSQKASNYNQKDALTTWRSIEAGGGITLGTLFYIAIQHGYRHKNTSSDTQADTNNDSDKRPFEADRLTKADIASDQANLIWQDAHIDLEHEYIKTKNIDPINARFQYAEHPTCKHIFWTKGDNDHSIALHGLLLLLPLYNIDGILRGLQAIDIDGKKSYQKGISKIGLFMPLFNPNDVASDYTGDIFLCEGFATAATILKATNRPTLMCIDAGNLKHVAKVWRTRCPKARIIIAGDFDKTGTGQAAAQQAALMCNGHTVFPVQDSPDISDFNDMAKLQGLKSVTEKLNSLQLPATIAGTTSIMNTEEPPYGVTLTCASSIIPEAIHWIWPGYIAAGKLHILAGVPATGKTSIALFFAAIISLGGFWPDGTKCEEGNVLIWSGEDDPKDTLVPRLHVLGANINNIYFISGVVDKKQQSKEFDPAKDFPGLYESAIKIGNIKLIIVDPIVNVITGDGNQNTNVRRCLQPLVNLAMQLDAAVLGITHFSKSTIGRVALDRVTGSVAFGALARIVLVTIEDTSCTETPRYLFSRAKSNIGQDGNGFYYVIEECTLPNNPNITTSVVVWRGVVKGRAAELLSDNSATEEKVSAIQTAKEFLISLLSEAPMSPIDIYSLAKMHEISKTTIDRAKKILDIESIKSGFGKDSAWTWHLTTKITKEHEDTHTKRLRIFDECEDLRNKLRQMHPNIIAGISLVEILSHAEEQDLEQLLDISVLESFANHLANIGKIKIT